MASLQTVRCDKVSLMAVQVVQMKDSFGDGSGCTMLISAWRDTLGASLKHTRKQPRLAPAQNATDEEPIASQVTS